MAKETTNLPCVVLFYSGTTIKLLRLCELLFVVTTRLVKQTALAIINNHEYDIISNKISIETQRA